jgi:hypothetical protein
LKIKITSGEKEEFDNLTGFEDITEALTLVEPWTKTITSEGIKTNISLKYGKTKISGVAVIGYNPFKLKLTTKIEGVKLTIKYIDDVVYLKSGKIAIRCKMSNLEKNISAILTMAGVDLKLDSTSVIPKAYTRLIDKLQGENTDINYLLKRVKSVKYNKGKLIVKANVGKDTVKLSLGKNTVAVSGVTLKGEKTSLKAKNIKNYTKSPKIKVKKSGYVKLANILKTLKGVQADKLLSAKEISFQTNIYAGNQVLKADVVLDYGTSAALSITTYLDEIKVNFIYREEKMYISAGNIQISCQTDEIDKAVSYILKLLGKTESTKDISFSDTIEKIFTGVEQIDINAKDIIDSITLFQYKKGSLNIGLKLSNTRFIIAIKKGIVRISIPDGLQKIEGCESLLNTLETFGVENVADNALSAKISNIKLSRKQSVKVSTKKYVPLMNIINVLDKSGIFNLLNSEGLEGDVTLRTGDTSITANIKLNYSDDIQAQISFMAGEGNNKTEIKIVYDNDMVYVSAGNIMLYSKVEELKSILQKALELADVSLDFDEESINRLTGFVNELTMKDVVNCISNLYCDSNTLKLTYKTEQSNIDVKIHNNSISVDGLKIEGKEIGIDFILNSTKKQKITVENKDKYINLSEIVELLTNNTGVCIDTSINGADLSLVYEKNEIYVNYDGLKIKADEGTAASVLNAIAKIYEIDLTDVFDVFGIKEDVQDINLNMFKQYADINDLTKLENSLSEGGNIGANITEILDMQMEPEGLRCSINLKNKVNVFIYNTDKHSEEPEDSGQYIDFASIDLLLKGFGKTAQNLNFDLSAKVKLGLNLGLIKFNLTDVPITAKIKVEQDGVYGNIHIDVPYMKNVTSNNFDLPEETTETVSDSSKTKTEYKTTYSLKSDTQEITSDLYIMPEYIYTHKKVAYSYEKTVTATSYKKIGIIWLPQSVTKNTEIVPVEQDYYSKSSYSQYSGAILENLGFTLNLTDDIVTMINDSATNNDISGTKISDIFQSYSYNSQKNQYTFGLDLSGITDGALGDTTVGITENEQGYLDKLDIDSSIYSILSLTMEGELNNIGQYVDIGFEPEKFPFSLYVND